MSTLSKIGIILLFVLILNISLNSKSSFLSDILLVNKVFNKNGCVLYQNNIALKNEINELKDLLNLKNITSDYELINATVINRDLKEYTSVITIDKGKKEGIKEDMAVITSYGLIGKTIKCSNHTSKVKLITSSDIYNKISVEIRADAKKVYGILSRYEQNTNSFIIEGIDDLVDINEGDEIYTTGLGKAYPNGILIGKVVRISKDNFDLSYNLKVKPSQDFDNFHYVAVLNRGFDD